MTFPNCNSSIVSSSYKYRNKHPPFGQGCPLAPFPRVRLGTGVPGQNRVIAANRRREPSKKPLVRIITHESQCGGDASDGPGSSTPQRPSRPNSPNPSPTQAVPKEPLNTPWSRPIASQSASHHLLCLFSYATLLHHSQPSASEPTDPLPSYPLCIALHRISLHYFRSGAQTTEFHPSCVSAVPAATQPLVDALSVFAALWRQLIVHCCPKARGRCYADEVHDFKVSAQS